MGPPGFVIPGPDPSVTVHANVGGTGEHEESFFRIDPFESFSGSPRHVISVQVVDLFVNDLFAVYIVIEAFVVVMAVGETAQRPENVVNEDAALCIIYK